MGNGPETAEGGQRRHQCAPGSVAMLCKVVPRSPRAFLQAQSLVLGWGGDARVSGKAEGREGKPRLLPPQPGFPLAVVS